MSRLLTQWMVSDLTPAEQNGSFCAHTQSPQQTQEPMLIQRLSLCLQLSLLTACDPLVSLQGSFWPPWIIAMLGGIFLTVVASKALHHVGLLAFMGPPGLIYTALWSLMTFITWLLAFDW